MKDAFKDQEVLRKREYHRRWRAAHPEAVKAAQVKYWRKVAQKMSENGIGPAIPRNIEIR